MYPNYIVKNSKGDAVLLNAREQRLAEYISRQVENALGYEIPITTLTTVIKQVTEQKFFEIAPADYMPVRVGQGAWSTSLTTFRSFATGGDFETGLINQATDNGRLASTNAAIDALSIPVKNWAKAQGWNVFEIEQAAKSGNWDIVTTKENSRKKNWDLGIQQVAFLGLASSPSCLGLLNQAGVTNNTTRITKPISSMTGAELKVFVSNVLNDYRSNCARSAWPTHFAIPESDYLGLAGPSSADFPLKSVLQVLEETFQVMTRNKQFKILPLAYGDKAYSSLGVQRYALYNYAEESLRMDIPVDYTSTLANSFDNFSFQNVGYGQFTGVLAYRPLELMYFSY